MLIRIVVKNSGKNIVKNNYSKRIIFDSDLLGDDNRLQVVTIPPQTKQREHFHDIQTEVFYILSGECLIYINDEEYNAEPGDAFICSPKDKHWLWNKTDREFKLAVFKINFPLENDSHWLEE
jgi:quercetin dioxygenase-like cupin family protein